MSVVLAIAPHPDDETLGAGGALLRHRAEGDEIHWLIVTAMTEGLGFSSERMAERDKAIDAMAADYRFASMHRLGFPIARLETMALGDIIGPMAEVMKQVRPEVVYLPFSGDVHSDHRVCFNAAAAATKSFRHPYVRRLLAYETLSETDFAVQPDLRPFAPNVFVDISAYLEAKIAMLGHLAEEMGAFPFPRSIEAVRALAQLRGAQAGCIAAEAFVLLKEIR